MTRILAVDPGLTTGACVIDAWVDDFRVVACLEIPWAHAPRLLTALYDGTFISQDEPQLPDVVVCETFRLRQARALQQVGSEFEAVQVIGMLRMLLYPQLLVPQEPSMMSRVQILPRDEEWTQGSEHRGDAYKHARYYFVTQVLKV